MAKRLTVTFHKVDDNGRRAAWWDAVAPSGRKERGGYMPIGRGVIPHDLAHLLVEGHFGVDDGVWGLLARGATYTRGTHRRPTKPGRQVVRDHRDALDRAEGLGNEHHHAWYTGQPSEVGPTFDRFADLWRALPDGGTLTVDWPTLAVLGCEPPFTREGDRGLRRNRGAAAPP